MVVNILVVIGILIAVLLILAAMKPDTFRVQRTTSINAPPDRIFPLINDFHSWPSWSPWENLDPAMKRTHSGSPNGKGAVYEWEGNKKVGSGRMEIMESTPASKIVTKLDFLKPFEAHNTAEYTLTPKGGATDVSWVMHGPSPFFSKVMQVFVSMDKLVGKDFEKGLANLKSVAEK